MTKLSNVQIWQWSTDGAMRFFTQFRKDKVAGVPVVSKVLCIRHAFYYQVLCIMHSADVTSIYVSRPQVCAAKLDNWSKTCQKTHDWLWSLVISHDHCYNMPMYVLVHSFSLCFPSPSIPLCLTHMDNTTSLYMLSLCPLSSSFQTTSAILGVALEFSGALQSAMKCWSSCSMGPGLHSAPDLDINLHSSPCSSGVQLNSRCWQQQLFGPWHLEHSWVLSIPHIFCNTP
jgi:hypothetical protein